MLDQKYRNNKKQGIRFAKGLPPRKYYCTTLTMGFAALREKYRYWRLGAVERYYFELKENNTHPFEDLGDGFYYILLRSDKFAFGIGVMLVGITAYTIFIYIIGPFSFPLIVFLLGMAYGFFCIYGNAAPKELIINRYSGYLLRIKGTENIIVEEPINNIYIKLHRKYDTNLVPHFFLILGGYRLDDIRLTGFAVEEVPLRILGGGVAARMGINFFDVDNNSSMHKIIHYPNRSLLPPPRHEFSRFMALHDLTERDLKIARRLEGLPSDSTQVPQAIIAKIQRNYGVGIQERMSLALPTTTDQQTLHVHRPEHGEEHLHAKRSKTLVTLLTLEEERDRKLKLGQNEATLSSPDDKKMGER